MRRSILLCISLLAVVLAARAEKVSPQQAAAVAEHFLQAESPASKAVQGAIRLCLLISCLMWETKYP